MRIFVLRWAAIAALTLMLTACSASAEVRDGPAPTPQAQPVVVVVQTSAPARDDAALVLLIGVIIGGLTALAIGYIVGHQRGRASMSTTDALFMVQSAGFKVLSPAQQDAMLRDAHARGLMVWHERR